MKPMIMLQMDQAVRVATQEMVAAVRAKLRARSVLSGSDLFVLGLEVALQADQELQRQSAMRRMPKLRAFSEAELKAAEIAAAEIARKSATASRPHPECNRASTRVPVRAPALATANDADASHRAEQRKSIRAKRGRKPSKAKLGRVAKPRKGRRA